MSNIEPRRSAGHPLAAFDPRWYARLFDQLGTSYDELPFTHGTEQETRFLAEALALDAGDRVLDVGCGSARHAVELARRGMTVTGVDLSSRLLELGLARARSADVLVNLMHADAREIPFAGSFDGALSICAGAFGVLEDDTEDRRAIERIRAALKIGGRMALGAVNRRFLAARPDRFPGYDEASGRCEQSAAMRLESGLTVTVRYRDRAYAADELLAAVEPVGFTVTAIHGSAPGDFGRHPVDASWPELLLLAVAR